MGNNEKMPRPGACCRAFTLSVPLEHIKACKARYKDGEQAAELFEPIGRCRFNPETGFDLGSEQQHYRCKALDPQGRCSIYADRPLLCRRYECSPEHKGCPSLGNGCSGKGEES